MELSQPMFKKIIAEEIQKVILEESVASAVGKLKQIQKKVKPMTVRETKKFKTWFAKQPEVKLKKYSSPKHQKEAFKNLSEKIADYVTKNILSVSTHTGGTIGLASAGQMLDKKMIKDLRRAMGSYRAPSPRRQWIAEKLAKKNAKFIKGVARKSFAAFSVVELAHYAMKRDWAKFNSTLKRNIIWWVAVEAVVASGPIGWMAAFVGGFIYLNYLARGTPREDIYGARGAGFDQERETKIAKDRDLGRKLPYHMQTRL